MSPKTLSGRDSSFETHVQRLAESQPNRVGYWDSKSYLNSHRRRFAATLRYLEDYVPQSPILEIGHGFGYITANVQDRFRPSLYVVADLNTPISSSSNRVLGPQGIAPVYSDVSRGVLPFRDTTFRTVLIFEVIEHLSDNVGMLVKELARILTREGRVYMSTPNFAAFGHRARLLAGVNPSDFWIDKPPYARHYREYTLKEISYLFQREGFATLKLSTLNSYAGRLAGLASAVVPGSKDTLFGIFEKS